MPSSTKLIRTSLLLEVMYGSPVRRVFSAEAGVSGDGVVNSPFQTIPAFLMP